MHKNVFSFLLQNGTDYDCLVQQNSELLRALEDLEKTVSTLREENSLLVSASWSQSSLDGSVRMDV